MGSQNRVGTPDLKNNSIGSAQVIDGSLTINDMNINGDAASVTSQTIPYENTALTPTIHDKISAIQSGITLISITWTSSGNIVDFTLSGYTLDPTIVYWVTAGGQIQQLTHDYVIDTGNTNLHFNYFPEVGLPITITFQHT